MDSEGIKKQVLSPIPILWCYWGPPAATAEWAQVQNDYIAEVVNRHPDRFLGMGTVAMQSPSHAVAELERLKKLEFPAVEIGTNVNGRDLDDPQITEILEAAQELDLAVFVHPWFPIGEERMGSFYLANIVGVCLETTLAISRLILGGVLERLPRLRIGFAHAGGAFPALLGRIDNGYAERPEAKTIISRPPSSYVHRLYFDCITHDPRILEFMCTKFGTNRVMLGSDYPFDMGVKHPLQQLSDVHLTENDLDDILFRTAEEFLGIK
jgi:aminocarboxymuconate-semialdehyde decarboxylase